VRRHHAFCPTRADGRMTPCVNIRLAHAPMSSISATVFDCTSSGLPTQRECRLGECSSGPPGPRVGARRSRIAAIERGPIVVVALPRAPLHCCAARWHGPVEDNGLFRIGASDSGCHSSINGTLGGRVMRQTTTTAVIACTLWFPSRQLTRTTDGAAIEGKCGHSNSPPSANCLAQVPHRLASAPFSWPKDPPRLPFGGGGYRRASATSHAHGAGATGLAAKDASWIVTTISTTCSRQTPHCWDYRCGPEWRASVRLLPLAHHAINAHASVVRVCRMEAEPARCFAILESHMGQRPVQSAARVASGEVQRQPRSSLRGARPPLPPRDQGLHAFTGSPPSGGTRPTLSHRCGACCEVSRWAARRCREPDTGSFAGLPTIAGARINRMHPPRSPSEPLSCRLEQAGACGSRAQHGEYAYDFTASNSPTCSSQNPR